MNDRNDQTQQQGSGSAEQQGIDRQAQFNELSELSLEERMAVADKIGLPVQDVTDAFVTGTMSGRDDAAGAPNDGMEDESTGRETER